MRGNTTMKIERDGEVWFITEWRKDKHSGEVSRFTKRIPNKFVEVMRDVLNNCPMGEVYEYRWVVRKVMEKYDISIDIDAWNGGRNRNKYYFPLHYYPLKILESLEEISYNSRGSIMVLKRCYNG